MLINRFFSVFKTAARGMEAQRIQMAAASENIANASTTRTADGTPYAIKRAVHEAPADRYDRFSDALNQARMRLRTSDPRHLADGGLHPASGPGDLGPETEVQEVMRLRAEFDPSHPHADADGYVHYPDVNVVEEMAQMISANRVYEANVTAVQAAKEMIKRTIEI